MSRKCPRGCRPAPQAALGMERGEWWLDEDGRTTFADGDMGDTNHEIEAFHAALELDGDDPFSDTVQQTWARTGKITPAQVKVLRARGVQESALTFFQKRNADARDYALREMGWTRVESNHFTEDGNFEVWILDDEHLRSIQRADFWEEGDEDSETEAFVEERSTGRTWSIPFKTLLGAQTAEGLKRYMDGAGKYR